MLVFWVWHCVRIIIATEYFLCARARLNILPDFTCLTLDKWMGPEWWIHSFHRWRFWGSEREEQSWGEDPCGLMINPGLLTISCTVARTTTTIEGQNNPWYRSNMGYTSQRRGDCITSKWKVLLRNITVANQFGNLGETCLFLELLWLKLEFIKHWKMHLIILYSMDYTLGNKITENSCICFVKLKNWEHEKKSTQKQTESSSEMMSQFRMNIPVLVHSCYNLNYVIINYLMS